MDGIQLKHLKEVDVKFLKSEKNKKNIYFLTICHHIF